MDRAAADTKTIAVIGLGHVGLPTALSLAEVGWAVVGTDSAREKVAAVAQGRAPFYEPGLGPLLTKHLASGRLQITGDILLAVQRSDIIFVCVGTPQRDDGSANLSQIEAVTRSVARHLNGYKLIVEKSTAPVRTAERIQQTLHRYGNGGHEIDVAVNPEFLQQGSALHDILHPDRIVVGVESERARRELETIYHPLLDRLPGPGDCGECDRLGRTQHPRHQLVVTDLKTAELVKHGANAFLAMKISFVNMLADLCESTGADITQVARGIGSDPRIGPHFLRAGIGYGGYCLPKDLRAFIRIAEDHGVDFSMLKEVARVNDRGVDRFCAKIQDALWVLEGKTIAIIGLAFKPETDDVREAPSLRVVERLHAEGASLRVYDPQAMENVKALWAEDRRRITFCRTAAEAAQGAHALVLLTEWDEFRELDLARIRRSMELPIVIDGRNFFDPVRLRELGFEYFSVGRP